MKIVINEMGRLRLVDRVDLSTTHIVAGTVSASPYTRIH